MSRHAPLIRDATREDLSTLVDTLSDSFANDPILTWVMPEASVYPDFFGLITEEVYLPRGITHIEDQGRGAALWLPPGERFEIPPRWAMFSMIARLVLKRGPAPLARIRRQGALFARHHPQEPHYYLQFIGCRQRDQGQGVGAALLKQGTRTCDEEGVPAYLESSNSRNVPLYQRHGFEVIAEADIPGGGPRAWFMWREPRT